MTDRVQVMRVAAKLELRSAAVDELSACLLAPCPGPHKRKAPHPLRIVDGKKLCEYGFVDTLSLLCDWKFHLLFLGEGGPCIYDKTKEEDIRAFEKPLVAVNVSKLHEVMLCIKYWFWDRYKGYMMWGPSQHLVCAHIGALLLNERMPRQLVVAGRCFTDPGVFCDLVQWAASGPLPKGITVGLGANTQADVPSMAEFKTLCTLQCSRPGPTIVVLSSVAELKEVQRKFRGRVDTFELGLPGPLHFSQLDDDARATFCDIAVRMFRAHSSN